MRRVFVFAYIYLMATVAFSIVVETASLRGFLAGSEPNCQYDNWISHLAEGIASPSYNLYAPFDVQTNGFGDFRIPTTVDLSTWNSMLELFISGDYEAAQAVLTAAAFPFQIVEFHDTDSGRLYYIIREIPDFQYFDDNDTLDTYDDEDGAFTFGWGLFIYAPEATRPVLITVPHPCDDFITPILGYLALSTWNAKYLLINGAGREVRWTNEGSYTNTKSISDPTRYAAHPLQAAYKKFADQIRSETGWREFSPQIHSYDWNRHSGYANCQISAGNPRTCPNLPIRDLSALKLDLINQGDHIMLPANTFGTHRDVYLNDYYSVNYSVHSFTFTDGTNTYAVNNSVDLPAYAQNQQMLYTQAGTSDYDVYEPFFHIEMDELPKAYTETVSNYNWFYGWNEALQIWDMNNLWTHAEEYYSRWIDDLEPVLAATFAMDDGSAPTTPANLSISNHSTTSVTLSWTKSSDFDFHTYEVLYDTTPIGALNYQIYSRDNASLLASQACESITVPNLSNGSHYYFRLRAKDKNGNYSPLSQEVNFHLTEAVLACTPSSVNFGQAVVGSPGNWENVTVSNSGWGTLDLSAADVALTGADADKFVVDISRLPVGLEHLETVLIPVSMRTTSEGAFSASLRLNYGGKTTYILLQGEVLPGGLIQIGTGTISTLNVPIQPNYAFTYSQSIYLQSELTADQELIRALYYYWNGLASADDSNSWDIYLGHTNQTSFASTADWIPLSSLTPVFSGVVDLPAKAGWVKIALTTAFTFDHSQNLVIAVDENELGFDGRSEKFLGTASAGYRSLLYRSDTFNPDPAAPPTATSRLQGFPNLLVQFLDEEPLPVELTSFTAVFSTGNSVNLTWTTQSETGVQGYYLFRSTSPSLSQAFVISPLIDAQNSSGAHTYHFTDSDLTESGTYFYWLQNVDFGGDLASHGPVSVYFSALGADPVPEIPLVTELKAVYPNPFNPTAFIPYSLANTADVSFKIYNARGQLLRTFNLGSQAPGNHQITWNGTDSNGSACGNGIYYIIMIAGKDSFHRKTVLLK